MKTLGERLSYLISTEKVSMLKFCETHKLSYQSINPICNNRRESMQEKGIMSMDDILKL